MKYVFVIENEQKFQDEIFEALIQIDPKLNIRFFLNLETFSNFVQKLVQDGKSAIHRAGIQHPKDPPQITDPSADAQLALLVCKDELLGHSRMDLLEKTHKLFARKGISTPEEPTNVVITAFDTEDFQIKLVEQNFINNVIFKPFDNLILVEHLATALTGRHLSKLSLVHRMKTQVEVEMIKDVSAENFSDVGFVTISPREVKTGQVSKYYGDLFAATKTNYVHARCWKSEKHPDLQGQFRCWFTFFGTPSLAHADYRRKLAGLKAPEVKLLKTQESTGQVATSVLHVAILEPNDQRRKELKTALEKDIQNCKVHEFKAWDELSMQMDPVGYNAQQKIQPWAGENAMILILDPSGHQVQFADPEPSGTDGFLGLKYEDLKKIDFQKLIPESATMTWLKLFVQKKVQFGQEPILPLASSHGQFLVKILKIEEVKSEAGALQGLRLQLAKPALDEKMKWYQDNLSAKDPFEVVICPFETTQKDVNSFKSIADSFVSKWKTELKVFATSEKSVEESSLRKMPKWLYDIHYFHHDFSDLCRKINLFTVRPLDANFKFFAQKSEVRVANPIELIEISESGLAVKYYRPLSLGSFRKFVLPKLTGEKVLEYLASCNFSEPDPNNKELHVNHFVFFGVKDLFLKNIRVWIRENYAHEKEKSAS